MEGSCGVFVSGEVMVGGVDGGLDSATEKQVFGGGGGIVDL